MNKDIVTRFMDNFGPNGVTDACILWLIRKNHLYFRPFTEGVVRRLLLEFCIRETENLTELRKEWDVPVISYIEPIILYNVYYRSYAENEVLSILDKNDEFFHTEHISLAKEHNYIVLAGKSYHASLMWKQFYNEIVINVIACKIEVFKKLLDNNYTIGALQENVSKIDSIELKEEYISCLFKGYSNSLFNRILSYSEPVGVETSVMRTSAGQIFSSSGYSILTKSSNYKSNAKRFSREKFAANNLLGMMTMESSVPQNPSDFVISQIGNLANSLSQIVEVIKSLLECNGITIEDLENKYGIHISGLYTLHSSLNGSSQHEQTILPAIKEVVKLPFKLTDVLNTRRARWIFDKILKKGWMKVKSDGTPEWLGVIKKGKDAQFAYLCGEIYGYKQSETGNSGNRVPSKELSKLFGICDIYDKLRQVHNQNVQPWQNAIDDLIMDCPEK